MHWYLTALRKYAVFSGRARRSEYWYFGIFNVLAIIALAIVGFVLGSLAGSTDTGENLATILYEIYIVAVFLPSLAVSVRRLHDTGRSGWWILLSLVPFAGIVLLIFYCLDSDPGPNRYGQNPKIPIFAYAGSAPMQMQGPTSAPNGAGLCARCGAPLGMGAAFCTGCGAHATP
ncbi:MAG: DUF805 domain-containing protein [bacterium]|nr:DUF805 domain-containing protein [bacterium]